MGRLWHGIIALLALLVFATSAVQADEVVLANGDRLYGDVLRQAVDAVMP